MNIAIWTCVILIIVLAGANIWQVIATVGREQEHNENSRKAEADVRYFMEANQLLRSYMDDKHYVWETGQSVKDFTEKKPDPSQLILISGTDLYNLLNNDVEIKREPYYAPDVAA